MNLPLILASSSPSRKMILAKLGVAFTAISPDVDETVFAGEAVTTHVLRLAEAKARKGAEQATAALIIGCDSVCVLAGEIVSKPENHANAVAQLQAASGKIIDFYSGLVLLNAETGRLQHSVVKTAVHFKNLSTALIEAYLQQDQPYHCAGSIKAEGLGIILIDKVMSDDPNSLVGLPLIKLIEMLEQEQFRLI